MATGAVNSTAVKRLLNAMIIGLGLAARRGVTGSDTILMEFIRSVGQRCDLVTTKRVLKRMEKCHERQRSSDWGNPQPRRHSTTRPKAQPVTGPGDRHI